MTRINRVISWNDTPDTEKRIKPLWWQEKGLSYTASGYGRKIPTERQIKINGRWRRVYCCLQGNIGTCYITDGPNWIIID